MLRATHNICGLKGGVKELREPSRGLSLVGICSEVSSALADLAYRFKVPWTRKSYNSTRVIREQHSRMLMVNEESKQDKDRRQIYYSKVYIEESIFPVE